MSELIRTRAGAPQVGLSRRKFLRLSASTAGTLAVLSIEPLPAALAEGSLEESQNDHIAAALIDVSRCVGCQSCERACCAANDLHPTASQWNRLGAQTFTIVDGRQVSTGQVRTVKRQCMHCLHPACVAACTVGAMTRTAEGAVVVDTEKCIGCRYCQYACPYGVPQFEWDSALGVARKCTSCVERLAQGEEPACTGACPSGALKFGPRDVLLQEARGRLKAHPEHYVNHIYGENEVGGAARLYISDVPFEQLGMPTLNSTPAPENAEMVMTRTPFIALGVAAVCTGIYSFLGRRRGARGRQTENQGNEPTPVLKVPGENEERTS